MKRVLPESEVRWSVLDVAAESFKSSFKNWMERTGGMVPLIVFFGLAPKDMPAAIWSAFGIQLFLILLDGYRSRYNNKVPFPGIVPVSLLLSYILCIILYYSLVPPLSSAYIAPIVTSGVTLGMLLSLVCMYPFTMQYSAPKVDESMRKSLAFYRSEQRFTLFWIVLMGVATGCTWASLLFESNSTGRMILGMFIPLVFTTLPVDILSSDISQVKGRKRQGHQ